MLLFGEDVLYLAYFDEAEIDLAKILEINEKGLELVNQRSFYSIVNMKNVYGSMDQKAKEFVAKDETLNSLKKVEILLINSLPMRILTKGYLGFNKPKTETHIVKSSAEMCHILRTNGANENSLIEMTEYLNTID